jgi:hypothetical protein
MKLSNVENENDVRKWLSQHLKVLKGVSYQWIEPNVMLGSTMGAPDINIKFDRRTVGLELKFLEVTNKGIKWTVRPVQRRYHHMLARAGGRSALMGIVHDELNTLILVRGDKIPLRDYASHPDSGCPNGKASIVHIGNDLDNEQDMVLTMLELLFSEEFWKFKDWIPTSLSLKPSLNSTINN